jgi:hypothetical protein
MVVQTINQGARFATVYFRREKISENQYLRLLQKDLPLI